MVPALILTAALPAATACKAPFPLAVGGPEFHGSMVLEIPLKGLDQLKEGQPLELDQFGGAVCDDTSLGLFNVTRHLKRRGELTRLELAFYINVRPSFDRAVSLYLTLMDGDRPGATMAITSVKAAEKRGTWARCTWDLKTEDFSKLFSDGHAPTLKVLMRVVNNE